MLSALDINDIQLLKILDRTLIGNKQLAIVDMKIYLGDLFLLDYFRGLYRLDISKSQDL